MCGRGARPNYNDVCVCRMSVCVCVCVCAILRYNYNVLKHVRHHTHTPAQQRGGSHICVCDIIFINSSYVHIIPYTTITRTFCRRVQKTVCLEQFGVIACQRGQQWHSATTVNLTLPC